MHHHAHILCQRGQQNCKSHQTPRNVFYFFSNPQFLTQRIHEGKFHIYFSHIPVLHPLHLNLFFLHLASFTLTGRLKVFRYWLHVSFWHAVKYAISHLHTGDWLTWQVSSLCTKHIKIVLHAVVVFNRNFIQLTQVLFGRFFSFHLMPNLLCCWQAHESSWRLLFLSWLCWLC